MKCSFPIRSLAPRLLASIAVYLLMAPGTGASELAITNQSFENPVIPDGTYVASVPGWTLQGVGQILNPNNSFFSGTADGTVGSPIDGTNVVGVNVGGRLIYQDTNWLIQPNSAYRLTYLAGTRIGTPFGNSSVQLWSGTNLLGEQFPAPTNDTFVPFSLSYTSPPSGPLIGTPLRIELQATGAGSQAWFDNFHLFANSLVCTPHQATATAQLVNGIFVGATITDPGCGYTNEPPVLIQGGGGNGAAATAVVTNGRVAAINVINGGCCYTNLPQILIGSPPFIPSVGVRFSKIIVTQHVVLGRKYVLESSSDLATWTAAGPSFTATSENLETEFDLSLTGRFFRLQEVP